MNEHTTKVTSITVGTLFAQTYVVPLYQREYAWERKEIWQLLDDLQTADKNRNYYLGSLTVFRRHGVAGTVGYELIDGQQRAITLWLLLRLLCPANMSTGLAGRLLFENRPEEEAFLTAFDTSPLTPPVTPRAFRAAVDAMRDHEVFSPENEMNLEAFASFVREQVVLFRVEMPPETDVSAYFEIMNNRGCQLEYHDLFKAKLIAKLPPEADKNRFDRLWTACADMTGHLLDKLPPNMSEALEKGVSWHNVDGLIPDWGNSSERSVISDFSGFLMHVLRAYLDKQKIPVDIERIPLDAENGKMKSVLEEKDLVPDGNGKKLLSMIDASDFLDVLLRTRIKFDRLVVKMVNDGQENNDNWNWRLDGGDEQLTYLESMLQVAYGRQTGWISHILLSDRENSKELVVLLEKYVRDKLTELVTQLGPVEDWICKGTWTPHLALNVIDYLMYRAKPTEYQGEKKFRFGYRNTVEHHFPQKLAENDSENWGGGIVHDIGNLCLMAGSENSSLNDSHPREKFIARRDKWETFPPKRREMYRITQSGEGWTPKAMKTHSEEVQRLLKDFLKEGERCVSGTESTPAEQNHHHQESLLSDSQRIE